MLDEIFGSSSSPAAILDDIFGEFERERRRRELLEGAEAAKRGVVGHPKLRGGEQGVVDLDPEKGVGERLLLALGRGGVGVREAAAGALDAAAESGPEKQIAREASSRLLHGAADLIRPNPELRGALADPQIDTWVEEGLFGAVEALPQYGATFLATAAGGPAAGVATAMAAESGAAYNEAVSAGADPAIAASAARITGVANGLLEYAPVGHALRRLRGFTPDAAKSVLSRIAIGALRQGTLEGTTEVAQGLTSKVVALAKYAGDKGLTMNDLAGMASLETLHGATVEGIAGFVLGAATGGAVGVKAPPYGASDSAPSPPLSGGEASQIRGATGEVIEVVREDGTREAVIDPAAGWLPPGRDLRLEGGDNVLRLPEAGTRREGNTIFATGSVDPTGSDAPAGPFDALLGVSVPEEGPSVIRREIEVGAVPVEEAGPGIRARAQRRASGADRAKSGPGVFGLPAVTESYRSRTRAQKLSDSLFSSPKVPPSTAEAVVNEELRQANLSGESVPSETDPGVIPSRPEPEQIRLFSEDELGPTIAEARRGKTGIVAPGVFYGAKVEQGAKKWLRSMKRFFRARGSELPQETVFMVAEGNQRVAAVAQELEFTVADFNALLHPKRRLRTRTDGTIETEEDLRRLADRALHGEEFATPAGRVPAIDLLPEDVAGAVRTMRQHINLAQKTLLDMGVIEPGTVMEAVILDSVGTYVRRNYRAFKDPSWNLDYVKDAMPEQFNRAVSHVQEMLRERSDREAEKTGAPPLDIGVQDAEGWLRLFLRDHKNPWREAGNGSVTRKDLSAFMRRADIDENLQAVLGRINDPVLNYVYTVQNLTDVSSKHLLLSDLREFGIRNGIMSETPDGERYFPTVPEAESYSPLAGTYVSESVKGDLDELLGLSQKATVGKFFRTYSALQLGAKSTKTVGSVKSQIRNVISNIPMVLANGNVRLFRAGSSEAKTALRAALEPVRLSFGTGSGDAAIRSEVLRMTRLGMLGTNPRVGMMKQLYNEMSRLHADEFDVESDPTAIRKIIKAATRTYGAEDDFWKVLSFYVERGRLQEIYPTMDEGLLDARAARTVQQTLPNYNFVPKKAQLFFRRSGIGNFIAFPWEILRTRFNVFLVAQAELAEAKRLESRGDVAAAEKLRSLARLRQVSNIGMVGAGAATISSASALIAGVDREDMEQLRRFMPYWEQYTHKLWIDKKTYVDLGFMDPFGQITEPMLAFAREFDGSPEGALAAMKSATVKFLESFTDGQFIAMKVVESLFNIEIEGSLLENVLGDAEGGAPIYNPADPGAWQARLANVLEELVPSTFKTVYKIERGVRGEKFGSTVPDPRAELVGELTGTRVRKADIVRGLHFKALNYRSRGTDATRIFSTAARQESNPERIRDAYINSVRALAEIEVEAIRDIDAARGQGVPAKRIFETMTGSGLLGKDRVRRLMNGTVSLRRPIVENGAVPRPLIREIEREAIADVRSAYPGIRFVLR